jgi:hypothetical protein
MGYHRPIDSFNAGKRAEHAERCYFREPGAEREHRTRLPVAPSCNVPPEPEARTRGDVRVRGARLTAVACLLAVGLGGPRRSAADGGPDGSHGRNAS